MGLSGLNRVPLDLQSRATSQRHPLNIVHVFEQGTSHSAVECSNTELYPQESVRYCPCVEIHFVFEKKEEKMICPYFKFNGINQRGGQLCLNLESFNLQLNAIPLSYLTGIRLFIVFVIYFVFEKKEEMNDLTHGNLVEKINGDTSVCTGDVSIRNRMC